MTKPVSKDRTKSHIRLFLLYIVGLLAAACAIFTWALVGRFIAYIAYRAEYRLESKQLTKLSIPVTAFPDDWTETDMFGDLESPMFRMYYSSVFQFDRYWRPTKECVNAYAYHVLAGYRTKTAASEKALVCIPKEYSLITWAPLGQWRYTSKIADEYHLRIEPTLDNRCPGADEHISIIIWARYGRVISEFYVYFRPSDITPTQVKELVAAHDQQFAANRAVWDR